LPSEQREAEIERLSATYGVPARRKRVQEVSPDGYPWWARTHRKPHGEVVLLIRRKNGNLILHSKAFYPAGTFRVPSGTLQKDEPLLDAVYREAFEETGLVVAVERFLGIVEFEFRFQGLDHYFPSYLFLLQEVSGDLEVMDPNEQISSFSEVAPSGLRAVAERLEDLPPYRCDWGRFRAYPHRLAAELLTDAL
jgi:ADP-ribose pyrophosphatase YjhB (NUDIX family)